jgi:hypothetical protein
VIGGSLDDFPGRLETDLRVRRKSLGG